MRPSFNVCLDPTLVRASHLYLSLQQLDAMETEKFVETLSNVGSVNIGRHGLVRLHLPTLEKMLAVLDEGRCERITFWHETLRDITAQRIREMAQGLILKGWTIRDNAQKLSISK